MESKLVSPDMPYPDEPAPTTLHLCLTLGENPTQLVDRMQLH